jgi:hypothetical protein
LKLTVRSADGIDLQAGDASRLELLMSANLQTPLSQWPVLPAAFVFQAGALGAEISHAGSQALFLLVRERASAN